MSDRQVGLIAGAGFDPRSASVAELLAARGDRTAFGAVPCERSARPRTPTSLSSAEENVARLNDLLPGSHGRVVRRSSTRTIPPRSAAGA